MTIFGRYPAIFLLFSVVMLAGCGSNQGDAQHANRSAQAGTPGPAADNGKSASLGQGASHGQGVAHLPDFSRLVKKVSPAVVNISARPERQKQQPSAQSRQKHSLNDWLKRFFGHGRGGQGRQPSLPGSPGPQRHVSLGSGFIISHDGYILTNRHVVAKAGQVIVKLGDRRQLQARIVATDKLSDIALLKVKADDLPTVAIGDPSALPVGSWVVAIGSPFGFETSVTAGIVSAKRRNLSDDQYVPFLQTDVATNPGNSGGPLFNLKGEVIGINSQIYSQTGGYQGVSFAIPINVAMNVAHQLRENGKVTRGWLGVQVQDVTRKLARSFDLDRPEGALVSQALPGSPASRAHLKAGDIILELNGHDVDSAAALPPLVGSLAPGKNATLTVLRDKHKKKIDVTIETLPRNALAQAGSAAEKRASQQHPFGMTLKAMSDQKRQRLGLEGRGVLVTSVSSGAAANAGLKSGDIILSVGSHSVARPQALLDALKHTGGEVVLLVRRDQTQRFVPFKPNNSH